MKVGWDKCESREGLTGGVEVFRHYLVMDVIENCWHAFQVTSEVRGCVRVGAGCRRDGEG